MADVHIKHFDEKFRYLFSDHPSIKTYNGLADAIKVSPGLISGWKNGTDTTHPEHIPIKHIGSVCDRLFVAQEVLELEDIEQFRARAKERPGPGPWETLVLSAPSSPSLSIITGAQLRENPALLWVPRGIHWAEEADEDVPVFRAGESILIRLASEAGWHAALFCRDRASWQALCPTRAAPETRISDTGAFYFPPQIDFAHPRLANLDVLLGNQLLVAVITKDPIPEHLRQQIMSRTDLMTGLQGLSTYLGEPTKPNSSVIHMRYYVTVPFSA
jgi:hypothetical protein